MRWEDGEAAAVERLVPSRSPAGSSDGGLVLPPGLAVPTGPEREHRAGPVGPAVSRVSSCTYRCRSLPTWGAPRAQVVL